MQSTKDGLYRLNNISGNTDSKGGETNVKSDTKISNLYLGYTYTDTRTKENGVKQENILTPKHRLNSILMYEVEDKWKIGLEAYYFSPQKLGDGQKGKQYVVCGFMIEKIWEMFHCMLTLKTSPTDGKPALILYIPEVYLILFSGIFMLLWMDL